MRGAPHHLHALGLAGPRRRQKQPKRQRIVTRFLCSDCSSHVVASCHLHHERPRLDHERIIAIIALSYEDLASPVLQHLDVRSKRSRLWLCQSCRKPSWFEARFATVNLSTNIHSYAALWHWRSM